MYEHLTPAYIRDVASTIFDQIKATTTWSMRGSWGAHDWRASVYKGMAVLAFKVQGLCHKGWVYVAYNEGQDCYEIYFLNGKGAQRRLPLTEVYCDNLGEVLDRAIERGYWTEEEYAKRALADSEAKMSTEA